MLLEAVYEQDFLPCSYAFRPGRSAHQALEAARNELMGMSGGYVLEFDIADFFGSMSHAVLREFLDKRIRDGMLRRVIGKWLKAGVLEDGVWSRNTEGTPQGGVISPLLANLYLHEVLDVWFEQQVKPRMRGHAAMVRYADDGVLVFAREDDARRVLDVLPKRFARFGLRLHPEKTRMVSFKSPGPGRGSRANPGSFDFLGFTHHWGKSRKGNSVIKQKTSQKRLSRALKRIREWCRENRHLPIRAQADMLAQKMRGHYCYYGITGNARSVGQFALEVRRIWRKWLARRSATGRVSWERFRCLLARYPLPSPRIVHSYVASS
jgi:group II intron reverse transcriptase/maturase